MGRSIAVLEYKAKNLGRIAKTLLALAAFFLPSFLLKVLLNFFGIKVKNKFKIGFSLLLCDSISQLDNIRIGHLNVIRVKKLSLAKGAVIGRLNFISGPLDLVLKEFAAIGNYNIIRRSALGVTHGPSELRLERGSKVTSLHYLDLTQSIVFGEHSILAGVRSQIWTHAYAHAPEGPGRIRIDGGVMVGKNVYVGSGVIINLGVKIADACTIGSASSVSKNLEKAGLYVSQGLRFIEKDYEHLTDHLQQVEDAALVEKVYTKKRA